MEVKNYLELGKSNNDQILLVKIDGNKDDNIYKSEALERYDRRTLTLVECQNRIYKI